jgi:hypothetical protein
MNGKKCTCEEDLAVLERVLEELLTTMEAIEKCADPETRWRIYQYVKDHLPKRAPPLGDRGDEAGQRGRCSSSTPAELNVAGEKKSESATGDGARRRAPIPFNRR